VAGEQSDARARDERHGVDNVRRQIFPSGSATHGRVTMKRFTASLVMGALLLSASGAFADERTEAKAHFKKGMQSIAEGKYEEGISELQRAYEIKPHPNVLYNIARAYAESGDLEGAVANYQKYLDGNPPDKDEVAQVLTALQSRMERQKAIQAASQQVAPGPGTTPGTTTPGTTPGTTTPGTTPGGAVAQTPGGPSSVGAAPGSAVNVGAAKTEDVFEESVVTASKGAQSPLDAPNSTSIITEQDIHLSGIIKIPELLRRLAGVDIMEDTGDQTDVSLRGFNQRLSNKVLVLIDGRSTFVDLIGSTLWATLPIGVEDIERIEVVRGPGSALYGADAFNGVINIITKAPGEGKSGFTMAYGDHNTAHGTISATGRDKETAYRLSAGFDNIPRWSREVGDDRPDLQTSGQQYSDQITAQKSVRLFGNVTRDLGSGVTSGVGGGYTNTQFNMGGYGPLSDMQLNADVVDVTAFLSSKHFDVHAFLNRYHGQNELNENYIGQSLLPATFDLSVADIEAQYIDDRSYKSLNNNLHLGLGYRYKYAAWNYLDGTHQENFEAAYLHDELKAGKSWAFVGDLRGDYVPYLGKVVGSPKASILFHPSAQSTIRGIAATAFRIPTFLEAYLATPVQLPFAGGSLQSLSSNTNVGSAKLKPEQVATEELGYLNSESDFFTFDSAIFHNYVNNLIDLAPNRALTVADLTNPSEPTAFSQPTNTYPLFFGGFENQCQAYNVYGGEFGIRTFPAEGLDFYANYTLMSVKEDTSGCTPAQLGLLPTTLDSRTSAHKLNAGVQFRSNLVDASIDFHYVSPQDWNEQVTNVQLQRIEYQSYHLDAYTLLNARAGHRFLQNHAEISVVAFNLLNDEHREHPFGNLIGQRFMGMFTYRF
jgi:outer membrane receptor for ferrienterochelin and colicin